MGSLVSVATAPPQDGPTRALRQFREVSRRQVPGFDLGRWPEHLSPQRILVTGGTGCVGRQLTRLLVAGGTGDVVSLARRPPHPRAVVPGVRYLVGDVRDQEQLETLLRRFAPELVVHLAAQRDPGRAERWVRSTATTNILGTRAVLEAAGRAQVGAVAVASTGKALRYYTADVYAGSKKSGEWLLADAVRRWGYAGSAARFTHIVENSIVAHRIDRWLARGQAVQLHAPHILLYVQSVLEAAQLVLLGAQRSRPGQATIVALNDLQAPIDLNDLALGFAAQRGRPARIEYPGYPAGYEGTSCPGTYGPATFDASPLVNALEVGLLDYRRPGGFDEFVPVIDPELTGPVMAALLAELESGHRTHDGRAGSNRIRARLANVLTSQLAVTARAVPRPVLNHVIAAMTASRPVLEPGFAVAHDVLRTARRARTA